MDYKLDAATFKIKQGLIDTFRASEDPLSNELEHVAFEMNSEGGTIKTIKFIGEPDVDAGG